MCKDDADVELKFPIRFAVSGTPASFQGKGKSKPLWQEAVRETLSTVVPPQAFACTEDLSLTIYDFPETLPQGDVDNIIKPIQDCMIGPVYIDDRQIRRVLAHRFLPSDYENDQDLPELIAEALVNDPPFVYISIDLNPYGAAK